MNSFSKAQDIVVPPSTLKRIFRDLDEINKNPVFGASICMPNQNDPLTLRANLFILDGLYKDLLIHMIIHLPQDYPITGPAVNIAPGLKFGHKYHEHLYDDLENGNQICSDLLTNMRSMYEGSKLQKSGWTPAYTLSAVLVQLQVFFADPDLPKHLLPTKEEIEDLRKHVRSFTSTIISSDNKEIVHSYDRPYPAIPSLSINQISTTEQISKKVVESDDKEARKNAEEWLYCAIFKINFFDKSHPILGYPLDIRQDQFGRYWPTPVIEMISYDAYILKVLSDPYKLENYENVRFKSSFGELYNFWIPVYINEEHWKRSYQHTYNAISVVRKGFRGLAENDFRPQMVLEVLPVILNKMIVQILQGKLHQSMAAIQAYCHFYRLLIRLIVEFPELQQKIDASVETMLKSEENRNKQNLGDMGEFLIKLALSKYGIHNASINEVLIEEYLARQVLWVLKEDPKFLKKQSSPKDLVKSFISHVKVSHQILVVAVETVKLVLSDSSISQTDNHFGLLPKKTMEAYQKKLSWIRETVAVNGNWEALVSNFKVDSLIRCEEDMAKMINRAFQISARQGYTWNSNVPSFHNSKKKYNEDIPYNPNFDFARATRINANNYSNHNQQQSLLSSSPLTTSSLSTKVISKGVLSNSKWEDMKEVDLKVFDNNPEVTVTVPKTKNTDSIQSSKQKSADSSFSSSSFVSKASVKERSGKFIEESKEQAKTTISHKSEAKNRDAAIVESKKTDTSNSTADNSISHDYDDSKKKKYRNNQRDKRNFFDDKPKNASKVDRKENTKKPESKEAEENKPKAPITRVSCSGTMSSFTWSETGGILKKVPAKVSTAK